MKTVGQLLHALAGMPLDAIVAIDSDVGLLNIDRVSLTKGGKPAGHVMTSADYILLEFSNYSRRDLDGPEVDIVQIY